MAEVTVGMARDALTVNTVTENRSIHIPLGAIHRMANPGKTPMTLIEVQVGDYLGEDDIVRLQDDYGRQFARTVNPMRCSASDVVQVSRRWRFLIFAGTGIGDRFRTARSAFAAGNSSDQRNAIVHHRSGLCGPGHRSLPGRHRA